MRDGYYARWQGEEFEASPDGERVRLYAATPRPGFNEADPGRYVHVAPAGEAELYYIRTVCRWQGEPFIVLGRHDDWLRVEYTGGLAPVAARLGLEEYDFGVYQGWVLAHEVSDLREQRV